MTTTAKTRPFVLLGDPVAHSLSPVMQNAAFGAAHVDGIYFALRCSADIVPALMNAVAHAGGGGNITIPHKAVAAQAVERATDVVRATGACNTFWLENGQLAGDNTDVTGVARITTGLIGSLRGARSIVIGSGGAARAAVCALLGEGASVLVLGRSAHALNALQSTFAWAGDRLRTTVLEDAARGEAFDVAVNATPLGMTDGDALPLDLDAPNRVGAIVDLVYRGTGTPWVRAAADRNIPVVDGREMLVAQGAAAFQRWWGVDAPVASMRQAIGLV